ncbi:hypothetical protein [Paenibacillus sp. MMO-58]|uniref:hypothetical protein n=1 Tax=Paenibacillus sp. MMO-58 TaxID=3081290 RepID=UPI00301919D4
MAALSMQQNMIATEKFNPRSSLIAIITSVQERLKQLYAWSGNLTDDGSRWEADQFSERKTNGECSTCGGSPAMIDIDPRRMIASELSLKRGAVLLWAGTNCGPVEMIKQLAEVLGICYDRPLTEQDPLFIEILLYGYKKELLTYKHKSKLKQGFYRGCVNDVKFLRDSGTTSKGNLKAIDYFSGPVRCPDCSQSSHYDKECLSVTINGLTINETSRLSTQELLLFVRDLLPPNKATVSLPILLELEKRLLHLNKIGLKYLSPVYHTNLEGSC